MLFNSTFIPNLWSSFQVIYCKTKTFPFEYRWEVFENGGKKKKKKHKRENFSKKKEKSVCVLRSKEHLHGVDAKLERYVIHINIKPDVLIEKKP